MASNISSSGIIDDQDLIDELRRYGEKNLPTLAASGSGRVSKKNASNQLNETNRDIYIKKLNHYKAREKAESNPSKYLQKQQQLSVIKNQPVEYNEPARTSNILLKSNEDQNDDTNDDCEWVTQSISNKTNRHRHSTNHKDIIELDDTTSEYVRVANVHTSPLSSTSMYQNENQPTSTSSLSPSNYSNRGITPLQNKDLNFRSLKEKLELDKSITKYRSEINDIINGSIVKNRKINLVNKYLDDNKSENDNQTTANENDDIVYAGTYTSPSRSYQTQTKVLYCPKPASSSSARNRQSETSSNINNQNNDNRGTFFNSFKFPFYKRNNLDDENHLTLRKKILNEATSNCYLTPIVKEDSNQNKIINTIKFKILPFMSNLGLQLSKLLPYVVLIIFTVIILQYLRMKILSVNDDVQLQNGGASKIISTNNIKEDEIHHFCDDIKDIQCSQTKIMLKELIDYLRTKSGQIDCAPPSLSSPHIQSIPASSLTGDILSMHSIDFIEKSVHLNTIVKYLDDEMGLVIPEQHKTIAVDSLLNAIIKNPHWHLRLLNSSYIDTKDPIQVTYIMSTISSKSFMCRVKELLHFLYVRVIAVASVIIALFVLFLAYKAIVKRNIERDKIFYHLVSQVTHLVEKHYELSLIDPNIKPYIAIAHIYDTLFDASQRASSAQKKLWSQVVNFIQDHESRIHLETQFINGEETHVWKWIVPKHIQNLITNTQNSNIGGIGLANSTMITPETLVSSTTNGSQSSQQSNMAAKNNTNNENEMETSQAVNQQAGIVGWQGDAFNRSEKLVHSPTPCLKIRNMFEPAQMIQDPHLYAKIHNDILEKFSLNSNNYFARSAANNLASGNNAILHISCDRKSKEGCVYIKCATNEAAGRAYQALNGTWYNGRLLTVKFLRGDRYLERFPESVNFTRPLIPIQL